MKVELKNFDKFMLEDIEELKYSKVETSENPTGYCDITLFDIEEIETGYFAKTDSIWVNFKDKNGRTEYFNSLHFEKYIVYIK